MDEPSWSHRDSSPGTPAGGHTCVSSDATSACAVYTNHWTRIDRYNYWTLSRTVNLAEDSIDSGVGIACLCGFTTGLGIGIVTMFSLCLDGTRGSDGTQGK